MKLSLVLLVFPVQLALGCGTTAPSEQPPRAGPERAVEPAKVKQVSTLTISGEVPLRVLPERLKEIDNDPNAPLPVDPLLKALCEKAPGLDATVHVFLGPLPGAKEGDAPGAYMKGIAFEPTKENCALFAAAVGALPGVAALAKPPCSGPLSTNLVERPDATNQRGHPTKELGERPLTIAVRDIPGAVLDGFVPPSLLPEDLQREARTRGYGDRHFIDLIWDDRKRTLYFKAPAEGQGDRPALSGSVETRDVFVSKVVWCDKSKTCGPRL